MPLAYDYDNTLKSIGPVIDEHEQWFDQVMRRTVYPELYEAGTQFPLPGSFERWVVEAEKNNFIEKITINALRQIHGDLDHTARGLAGKGQTRPPTHAFDQFVNKYEDFIVRMRRIERDAAQADSGIDAVTGLRSQRAMDKDLERELERRSRRGMPFCLVVARLDNFHAVREAMDEVQIRTVLEKASVLIKKCVRSFDDAYRSGEAEFVMALKHSDVAGGTAAINRLRGYLEEDPIIFNKDGQNFSITMSYCASEPMPGDVIETLLTNMRQDLSAYEGTGDQTLEYAEQSPLERFVNLMGDDDAEKASS